MGLLQIISHLFGKNNKQENQTVINIPISSKQEFSINKLTDAELTYCNRAGIPEDIGLFLKQQTKAPIEQLELFNELDEQETDDNGPRAIAICSATTEEKAKQIIAQHLENFIAKGQYIYISELSYKSYKLAIIGNTADPYEIMQFTGTNGCNFEILTQDIIAKCKKWDYEFGIRAIGIGIDFCEYEIINKNINYQKLAEEVYEFCPDVVDQGTETVETLALAMKESGSIYLWWD